MRKISIRCHPYHYQLGSLSYAGTVRILHEGILFLGLRFRGHEWGIVARLFRYPPRPRLGARLDE